MADLLNKRLKYRCDSIEDALTIIQKALVDGRAYRILVRDDRGGNGGILLTLKYPSE